VYGFGKLGGNYRSGWSRIEWMCEVLRVSRSGSKSIGEALAFQGNLTAEFRERDLAAAPVSFESLGPTPEAAVEDHKAAVKFFRSGCISAAFS